MPTTEELAAAFHTHYKLGRGDRSDRLAASDWTWAWEAVTDAAEHRDDELAQLLDALLSLPDADAAYLAYVGAGVLEDSLKDAPAVWGHLVAERCRRSSAWRQAVAGVYVDGRDREAVPMLEPYLPAIG